ncbi:hypothetical protein [Dysgonomonas sp. GY75]|nr:hypothetical protein [Dysgonomonas sp. GY75]
MSSDKKRAEHEHLHAFREDIPLGNHEDDGYGGEADEDEEGTGA